VLLLLPPSEGKAAPRAKGRPVDLATLSFPELTSTREKVLDSLVSLCRDAPDEAAERLHLPQGLYAEIARNAGLRGTPARPAGEIYTGVLYDALGLLTLDAAARRRAARRVVVISALWGAVRPGDRVPPYRLSMAARLPGLGTLAATWREGLSEVLPPVVGRGLVVDLRSTPYAAAWRPDRTLAPRTVAIRVLAERAGRRTVVSHMAKLTRGEVARHLLVTGADPRTAEELREELASAFTAELVPATGGTRTIDIIKPA
jgi:cytoplasmic iron level regulating protein YaaA (DUF328/UPF0246 family)